MNERFKSILAILAFSFLALVFYGQNKVNQIGIKPFFRRDNYPAFTNAINVISTNNLKIKGNSWGINAAYKMGISNNFSINMGLGYFRYSFNKIESTSRIFGNGNERIINYPTSLDLILTTDRYWYNSLSFIVGINKAVSLNKNTKINFGGNLINYYTLSQYYHVPYDNSFIGSPELKIRNNFKTKHARHFGLGGEFHLDVLKNIGKISFGPSLLIPIYNNWRKDKIFPTESNTESRSKWFKGVGIGIVCNYSLQKIKK